MGDGLRRGNRVGGGSAPRGGWGTPRCDATPDDPAPLRATYGDNGWGGKGHFDNDASGLVRPAQTAQPRSFFTSFSSSATVQRSSLSMASAIVHGVMFCTLPPCTKNTRPVKGRFSVAR